MKKVLFVLVIASAMLFSSCATIVHGGRSKSDTCQVTKPANGQPQRKVRVGALIADCCLGFVWIAVDYSTGALFKPCETPPVKK